MKDNFFSPFDHIFDTMIRLVSDLNFSVYALQIRLEEACLNFYHLGNYSMSKKGLLIESRQSFPEK